MTEAKSTTGEAAGIYAAARWHDQQAESAEEVVMALQARGVSLTIFSEALAKLHRHCAAELRYLAGAKSCAAPAPLHYPGTGLLQE